MLNKMLFLVFMTFGFSNIKTQETTQDPLPSDQTTEDPFHHHDLSGIWHVLNATGLDTGTLYNPRCWSIIFYKTPSNEFKGVSIFLDKTTNEQVSFLINAVQVHNENDIIFKFTSPSTPQHPELEYYIRVEYADDKVDWSKLETAEAKESVGGLVVTEDGYSMINNTYWVGCGRAFDYSEYVDTFDEGDENEREILPSGRDDDDSEEHS